MTTLMTTVNPVPAATTTVMNIITNMANPVPAAMTILTIIHTVTHAPAQLQRLHLQLPLMVAEDADTTTAIHIITMNTAMIAAAAMTTVWSEMTPNPLLSAFSLHSVLL